jgi:hypothetical protein
MFKFKFLLWAMTKLMQRAINTQPACAQYVSGKRLTFQIRTADGMGRTFRIQDGKVKSSPDLSQAPQFTMTFRNAAKGFAILAAKDGKEAFLAGLRDEDLKISGDFVEVMWFQGFSDYLQAKPSGSARRHA